MNGHMNVNTYRFKFLINKALSNTSNMFKQIEKKATSLKHTNTQCLDSISRWKVINTNNAVFQETEKEKQIINEVCTDDYTECIHMWCVITKAI